MTVEVATFLPLQNGIESSAWSLTEPLGMFTGDYDYGADQVVRYTTARWRAKLRFTDLSQSDRHLMARFVAMVGRHRPFYVVDPSLCYRGAFAATELLTASKATAAYWTPGTNRSVTADVEGIHVAMSGATASSTVALASALTVVANAQYAFRTVWEPGPGSTMQVGLTAGSTGTGTGYGSLAASSTAGRRTLRCQPTATSMYVGITDSLAAAANWATPLPWYKLRKLSVARCATVDGGSGAQTQTGSAVYIQNLSTSTSEAIAAGDMLEVVSAGFTQMVRATENVHSDSSGKGYLKFEPQLRGAVSNGDLVIPVAPMVRMVLAEEPELYTRSGWYSSIELDCMEAFG